MSVIYGLDHESNQIALRANKSGWLKSSGPMPIGIHLAVDLDLAVELAAPAGAAGAWVQAQWQTAIYRVDGLAATADAGFTLSPSEGIRWVATDESISFAAVAGGVIQLQWGG